MRDIRLRARLLKNIFLCRNFQPIQRVLGKVLMNMLFCSVQIISRLDSQSKFQMFTLCWCSTEVHQHGGSILGSVNLSRIFRRISEVKENAQSPITT